MKTRQTLIGGLLLTTLFAMSTIQAGPANGPCPKYQGDNGRCTGNQPRHCTYKGKAGLCHTRTDHETGDVSCRCFPRRGGDEARSGANQPLEFDPELDGETAVDPDSGEPIATNGRPTCIGMKFPQSWYPKGVNEARFWGGCTLIAWRYPAGEYRKPNGGVLKWGGGHSPFRRTGAD